MSVGIRPSLAEIKSDPKYTFKGFSDMFEMSVVGANTYHFMKQAKASGIDIDYNTMLGFIQWRYRTGDLYRDSVRKKPKKKVDYDYRTRKRKRPSPHQT
jgi:hypothetical protein